jgi:hypothetical protein
MRFYNARGTAEQWIKEGKNAVKWTKLSCRRFKDNQARLQLFALAYNLANFLRQLVLPKPIQGWTLTTLRGVASGRTHLLPKAGTREPSRCGSTKRVKLGSFSLQASSGRERLGTYPFTGRE